MLPDGQDIELLSAQRLRRKRAELEAELRALTRERARLEARVQELREALEDLERRFAAYRRRAQSDRVASREVGMIDAVRTLLPAIDDLERTLFFAERAENEQLREGLRMALDNLARALAQLNIHPIQAVGEKFDPHLHEAVGQIVTEEVPEETVLEVVQKGYRYKDTVIRPARVKVAVRKEA